MGLREKGGGFGRFATRSANAVTVGDFLPPERKSRPENFLLFSVVKSEYLFLRRIEFAGVVRPTSQSPQLARPLFTCVRAIDRGHGADRLDLPRRGDRCSGGQARSVAADGAADRRATEYVEEEAGLCLHGHRSPDAPLTAPLPMCVRPPSAPPMPSEVFRTTLLRPTPLARSGGRPGRESKLGERDHGLRKSRSSLRATGKRARKRAREHLRHLHLHRLRHRHLLRLRHLRLLLHRLLHHRRHPRAARARSSPATARCRASSPRSRPARRAA